MRINKAYLLILVLLLVMAGCSGKSPAEISPVVTAAHTVAASYSPDMVSTATPVPSPVPERIKEPSPTPMELTLSVETPTPTPSPVPTPSPTPVPFLGIWVYEFEGSEIVLELRADGNGRIQYGDNEQPLNWTFSDGTLILIGTRATFTADISGNSITLSTADGSLDFARKER